MAVQWFPGHMHLTQKAIADRLKTIDVVIEMLDARLPGSSLNPMLKTITQGKRTLKVLNNRIWQTQNVPHSGWRTTTHCLVHVPWRSMPVWLHPPGH